jgi:CRISPR/Cas system-associated protein Cas10 (large subunit of type III CRISPR-Cas system)
MFDCPFCEYTTESEHGLKIHVGKKHDRSLRPSKPCDWCGEEFEYKKSHEEQRRFCSMDCKGSFQESEWTNEDHPRWDGGDVTVECEWCDVEYEVAPHKQKDTRFCSRDCFGSWKSHAWAGEGSPIWKGGYSRYIGNWRKNRRKALKRDNDTCQVCGTEEKELHVHHIKPVVEFDEDDPSMHELSNMITLCSTCHPKVENGNIECPKPESNS